MATRSPVRVRSWRCRIDQNRAGHSARDPQVASRELHGRGLHAILGEYSGCGGGGAGRDQAQVVVRMVVLDTADAAYSDENR